MLNQTRRALEEFDNQHDFERPAADVLNGLGYGRVEPVAPAGGADGGQDITFEEGDVPGVALVTLEKKIRDKFKRDLAKQPNSGGVLALFCDEEITASMKLKFAREAIAKGYRLEVFDLERLRSLLDTGMKDLRRRYLRIDDDAAARLRARVTFLERLLVNKLPCSLFDILMEYEEEDVLEMPEMGHRLHRHLRIYYEFRQQVLALEQRVMARIGQRVHVRFRAGWQIYLKYVILRFAGKSKEEVIAGGDFLNYDVTWDDAERVFGELSKDAPLSGEISSLLRRHQEMAQELDIRSFFP